MVKFKFHQGMGEELSFFGEKRDFFVYMLKKTKVFVLQVKEEMKKVSWTKREELFASTSVVIITVLILCIYIALIDMGFTKIIDIILR